MQVKFIKGGTSTAEQTVNSASNNTRYASITTSYVQTFDGSTYVICETYNHDSGPSSVFGGSILDGSTFQMVKLT